MPYLEDPLDYEPGGLHPVHIGDTFAAGRYEVIDKLGHGCSSTIWLARDLTTASYVSLKIIEADRSESSTELMVLKHLEATFDAEEEGSQHVVRMLDHFVHEGPNGSHLCIVQEFLGPTLTTKIEANSASSKPKARRIAGQLLHAVAYLHKRGIAHGDLHTGNILLCIPASLSIDFGTPIRDTCGLPATPSPHRPKYLVGPIIERVPNKFIRSCLDKPHIKVCDFSESYMTGMTEPPPLASPHILRPPEGILGDLPHATLQTDIWGLAVVIFQILTNGGSLFSSLNDDYTLETIVLTLGKLPEPLWRSWSNREKFFDDDVNPVLQVNSWSGLSGISSKTSLKETIGHWPVAKEEILALEAMLEAMLRYDAKSRCSLSDLVHCDWMVGYGHRRGGGDVVVPTQTDVDLSIGVQEGGRKEGSRKKTKKSRRNKGKKGGKENSRT